MSIRTLIHYKWCIDSLMMSLTSCCGFVLVLVIGYIHVECVAHVRVDLHSDLISMIGQPDDNDVCSQTTNTSDSDIGTTQHNSKPLMLSQYSFSVIKSSCNNFDIARNTVTAFNWSCFTTESQTSRDINLFFVDCVQYEIVSVKCLEKRLLDQVMGAVCGKDSALLCVAFATGEQKHVCSRRFELRRILVEATEEINDSDVFPSTLDVIACVCALFILVTFIVVVFVPAEKCKPHYSYQDDVGLRVPLEIYEMYGLHYKPSARRKVNDSFVKRIGSISYESPSSNHLQNIAVVANSELDICNFAAIEGKCIVEDVPNKDKNAYYTDTTPGSVTGVALNGKAIEGYTGILNGECVATQCDTKCSYATVDPSNSEPTVVERQTEMRRFSLC